MRISKLIVAAAVAVSMNSVTLFARAGEQQFSGSFSGSIVSTTIDTNDNRLPAVLFTERGKTNFGLTTFQSVSEASDRLPEVNARGDHEWYIGSELRLGSTDEEPFSPALPHSTIQLKRIQVRHEHEIMGVPGVHSFGIGAKGFVVGLLPENRENRKLLPPQLEGVPVIVELHGMPIAW